MLIILMEIVLLILAYLLGSIPSALIISKIFKGIDIREHGSHNMGATNVLRVMGIKYSIIVFVMDLLKAGIVVSLFSLNIIDTEVFSHLHPLVYGVAAIVGHMFPIFAKFRGGKGVACSAGVLLAYAPIVFLVALFAFLVVVLITHYVSLGSIMAVQTAFIVSFFFVPLGQTEPDIGMTIIIGIIFIWILITHRSNIQRLQDKTESQITLPTLDDLEQNNNERRNSRKLKRAEKKRKDR